MQKQRKKILISITVFFLILCPLFISLVSSRNAKNQQTVFLNNIQTIQSSAISDPETVQIATSDLIKNFKFEKFGEDYINPATNTLYNGTLIFEIGANWRIEKDNLKLQYKYTVGNRTYLFYTLTATNEANIYTNCRLANIVEKDLSTVTDHLLAGTYTHHYGLFNLFSTGWKSYLDFTHYDFGDIINHNAKYNTFSGSLQMSFDVNAGILPESLTYDDEKYSKIFDYIGIDSVVASQVRIGNLSSTDPNIGTLTPREYRTVNRTNTVGGDAKDDMNGLSNNYDPQIELTIHEEPTTVYAEGIQHTSAGASLNPLTKKGDAIWDADEGKSVENCSFSFNVGSVSPRVEKHSGTLSYYQQKIVTEEYLASIIPWEVKSRIISSSDIARTYTRDAAVTTVNRFIKPTLEITFNLYTAYEIEERETPTSNYTLVDPVEEDEDMGWEMIVDGYGGASTFEQWYTSDWVSDLLFIQTYLKALEDGTITGGAEGPGGKIGKWWKDLSIWGKIGVGIVIVVAIFVAIGVVHAIRISNQNIKRKKREDELSL